VNDRRGSPRANRAPGEARGRIGSGTDDYNVNTAVEQIVSELRQPIAPRDML
jgi:hypothetical protein